MSCPTKAYVTRLYQADTLTKDALLRLLDAVERSDSAGADALVAEAIGLCRGLSWLGASDAYQVGEINGRLDAMRTIANVLRSRIPRLHRAGR